MIGILLIDAVPWSSEIDNLYFSLVWCFLVLGSVVIEMMFGGWWKDGDILRVLSEW